MVKFQSSKKLSKSQFVIKYAKGCIATKVVGIQARTLYRKSNGNLVAAYYPNGLGFVMDGKFQHVQVCGTRLSHAK